MESNKLMIGDWVMVAHSGNATHYAKVTALTGGIIECLLDGCGVLCKSVEPIPITPEILEKNGLGKLVTYGTEKWVCENFRLNVYDSGATWRFCAYTNRNEDSVLYIRFIHELQHALRLCGIEKEIVL